MQLKVSYPALDGNGRVAVCNRTVTRFADIVIIGADVARSVRVWLRGVPMTSHESRLTIQVHATWVEGRK